MAPSHFLAMFTFSLWCFFLQFIVLPITMCCWVIRQFVIKRDLNNEYFIISYSPKSIQSLWDLRNRYLLVRKIYFRTKQFIQLSTFDSIRFFGIWRRDLQLSSTKQVIAVIMLSVSFYVFFVPVAAIFFLINNDGAIMLILETYLGEH